MEVISPKACSYSEKASRGVRNLTILRYYGPEFVAQALQEFLEEQHVGTLFIILFIVSEAPRESGVAESFNSRLRDELLDRELFVSLAEARVILEKYRTYYFEE